MRTESQIRILIKKDFRWVLAIVIFVVALLALRTLVIGSFSVTSASMQPTLMGTEDGGDRILVNKLCGPPKRYDIVLFEEEGKESSLIKRVVGLPGEKIEIEDGECLINGRMIPKSPAELDRVLVPILRSADLGASAFDRALQRSGGRFKFDRGRWTIEPNCDEEPAILRTNGEIRDGMMNGDGEYIQGVHAISDLAAELFVIPRRPGVIEIELRGKRGRFVASLATGSVSPVDKSMVRLGALSPELLAIDPLPLDTVSRVHFAHVDERVTLRIGERVVLSKETPPSPKAARNGVAHASANGISFAFSRGWVEIVELNLYRDLYFIRDGAYGIGHPFVIPEGHYFLLGDHSRLSRDSRRTGSVPGEAIIGRALFVFWPLGRARSL